MTNEQFMSVDGLRIAYRRAGKGPLLFLIHGQTPGSCFEVDWDGIVDHFAELGFCVFTWDQPGFGESDNPEDYSIAARIRHAAAVIESQNPLTYSLWGSSMGGYLASCLALEDPRAKNLVLMPASVLPPVIAPPSPAAKALHELMENYSPSITSARQLLEAIVSNQSVVTPSMVKRFAHASGGKNDGETHRRRAEGRPPPLGAQFGQLATNNLLIWGRDEISAPVERAVAMLRLLRRGQLHVLDHCAHWPQLEQPAQTCRLVHDFLIDHAGADVTNLGSKTAPRGKIAIRRHPLQSGDGSQHFFVPPVQGERHR